MHRQFHAMFQEEYKSKGIMGEKDRKLEIPFDILLSQTYYKASKNKGEKNDTNALGKGKSI